MQVNINQRSLANLLNAAKAIADTSAKPGMPILGDVVLRGLVSGGLQAQATDMSVSITETTEADVIRPGAVAAPVKRLAEIVSVLPPSAEVTLSALDNHWVQIKAGKSDFKLMGHMDSDFPSLPAPNEKSVTYDVDTKAWLDLFDRVGYAMSSDEARVNLNGALVEADGQQIKVVATDGHRLTYCARPLDGLSLPSGIVLPKAGIDAMVGLLKRAGESVTLVIDPPANGNQRFFFVQIDGRQVVFSMRITNVQFPPYKQVIPSNLSREVLVSKAEFESALRSVIVMAPEKTAQVALTFKEDRIEMHADNPDLGVTHQEVAAECLRGEPCTAGFNARYLLEAVSKMPGETVKIQGHHELDPLLIGESDQAAVVMPMRL